MFAVVSQVASSFIAPALAGAGAAAITVPIAIHLLSRLRRKRQRWGAMRFLRLAYQKQKNRLRLEQWLLLTTRCLLVLLIGLALAGPVVGGAVARWLSGAAGGGRTVHVVVDDSLTSGVRENAGNVETQDTQEGDEGASRLETLKRRASALIDAAGPGDRVVLWRTTAPGSPVDGVSNERGAYGTVRDALDQLEPGYGAADWAGTVVVMSHRLEDEAGGAGRPVVAVLSGFSRGAGRLDEAASGRARLGDAAAVGLLRPMASRANRQVAAMTPRRSVVLAGDSAGGAGALQSGVDVAVTLRRFEDTAEAGTAELRVELWGQPVESERGDGDGESDLVLLSSASRSVVWSVGQDALTQTVSVAVPTLPEGRVARGLAVRAAVVSPAGRDALAADDAAWAVVEVRRRLRVGVQGGDVSAAGAEGGAASGLGPAAFVRAALGGVAEAGAFEVVSLARVDAEALEPLDAVFVLSPGRLGAGGWSAVAAWVEGGGVAWVTPDAAAEGSLAWPGLLARALLGVAGASGSAEAQAFEEPVGLAEGRGAPPALSLLSGSWPALLSPVRVSRHVPWAMEEPESGAGFGEGSDTGSDPDQPGRVSADEGNNAAPGSTLRSDAVWLRLGPDAQPWLTAHRRGRGTVLVLGSALDPAWTNLAAKPLFPALVQDALRSAVASSLGRRTWDADAAPPAGVTQRNTQRLAMSSEPDAIENGVAAATPIDDNDNDVNAQGFARPGVFFVAATGSRQTDASTPAGLFALNPNAAAGDTAALDEAALGAWWDATGAWSFLPDDPAELLAREAPRAALGWLLLWAVLALVLVEAALSRWFSHAASEKPGVRHRAMSLAKRWRHGEFAERGARKAA